MRGYIDFLHFGSLYTPEGRGWIHMFSVRKWVDNAGG